MFYVCILSLIIFDLVTRLTLYPWPVKSEIGWFPPDGHDDGTGNRNFATKNLPGPVNRCWVQSVDSEILPIRGKSLATPWLGGGFKYFLFSSLPGEDSHFDQYFSDGLKPPTRWPKRRCCFLGDPNARRAFFVSKIVDFQGSLPMCFKTEVWQIFLAGKFADYICNIYIYITYKCMKVSVTWMKVCVLSSRMAFCVKLVKSPPWFDENNPFRAKDGPNFFGRLVNLFIFLSLKISVLFF